jgi:RNA polymerase sigma-70 factor (ECF subfamily)
VPGLTHSSVFGLISRDTCNANDEPKDLEVAWVRRALDGDQDAYTWLANRYETRLRMVLQRRLGSRWSDAEDAVQETLTRAFRALDRYDARYRFSTWLFTIGLRVVLDMQRAHRRQPLVVSDDKVWSELADRAGAATTNEGFDASEIWEQAKRYLNEAQSTALWLRYAEDLSIREIAMVLGKTQVGIRVLLHRARLELMKRIGTNSASSGEFADPGGRS